MFKRKFKRFGCELRLPFEVLVYMCRIFSFPRFLKMWTRHLMENNSVSQRMGFSTTYCAWFFRRHSSCCRAHYRNTAGCDLLQKMSEYKCYPFNKSQLTKWTWSVFRSLVLLPNKRRASPNRHSHSRHAQIHAKRESWRRKNEQCSDL